MSASGFRNDSGSAPPLMPRYTFWHETSSESLPSAALITCIVVVYLLSLQRSRHFWWKKGTLPCTPRSTVLYLRKLGPVSVIRRVGVGHA